MPERGRMPGPIMPPTLPQPPFRPTYEPGWIKVGPNKWPKGKPGFGDPGLPQKNKKKKVNGL
jgi:hypothetical protein